jgi:hypothetical protein
MASLFVFRGALSAPRTLSCGGKGTMQRTSRPPGGETMERALMPTLLERTVQLGCSAARPHLGCRRGICRRYRLCVPPRDPKHCGFYRCPFDSDDAWESRADLVEKIAARLMKIADAGYAARGEPLRFAPAPPPDHLDLTKPLEVAALRPRRNGGM